MKSLSVGSSKFTVDNVPDLCPICNFHVQPLSCFAHTSGRRLQIVFRCVRQECDCLFFAYYRGEHVQNVGMQYHFIEFKPKSFISKNLNAEIRAISPNFEQIYNQALHAESLGLNHIVGPGYRKALEFLIKDYLIGLFKEQEEKIKKMFLGNCIKELINNENIKLCAERAVWLGNDETHYTRTWEDKDISHMKELIELTIYWISSEVITKRYLEEMN
ncbi:hypothetical protein [Cohnella mopanensis]|uniref:hypothetical protein n=1 Tax=Cohnella mopanensis TaxID=2911966 RepID=UPI001EF887DE|nr:hypothetical protein [Cohnella mopanensis]